MKMRQAVLAALRGDPDLVPKVTRSLRGRIDEEGRMSTVVQAAEALEPILREAVRKRPSRLGKIGYRSAHLLAGLTAQDDRSNRLLAEIARGSTVGIVFADMAGFTSYTDRHGDESAIELLSRLHEVVEKTSSLAKGKCVKHLGDGFLLAFPSASQAIRAALDLRDRTRHLRAKDPSFEVRLRISVHAGEPLVERDDLLGHDVNLTARLLDHCKPDQVVVSEAAKELAGQRLRSVMFGPAKVVKVRGLAGKVRVHYADRASDRVVGKRASSRSRAPAP